MEWQSSVCFVRCGEDRIVKQIAVAFERKFTVKCAEFETKVFECCFVAKYRLCVISRGLLGKEYCVDLLLLLQLSLKEFQRNKHRTNDALLRLQGEFAKVVALN